MVKFAQISDCHLKENKAAMHHGADVYQQLIKTLTLIKQDATIEFIIFTGDLTQDHSEASYRLFNQAFIEVGIAMPTYYLAGNHDEHNLLTQYLSAPVFNSDKIISLKHWQIQLINTKSETPAGNINKIEIDRIARLDASIHHFLLMHHHPVDVGYFIDRHGLENKSTLWQCLENTPQVKGLSCGHVHRGMELSPPEKFAPKIKLFSCPATSITFENNPDNLIASLKGVGYRTFELHPDGEIASDLISIMEMV